MTKAHEMMLTLPRAQMEALYQIRLAELSFYEFFKQAWSHLERKGIDYEDNWHIKALCDHLQACFEGKIKNLILNLSPRCGKSTIFIAFFAWVWLKKPETQFMFASHSFDLATEGSRRCRSLIMCDWYQLRWGDRFKLTKDTEDLLINDKKGFRRMTTPTSKVTGHGADFLIADDLNDMKEVMSDTKRDSTNEWFKTAFASRVNNPRTSVRIVQQQRGHMQDVAGYIMGYDKKKHYVRFIIPMRFELDRKCATIDLDDSGEPWSDPRTEEGELMWPERFTKEYLETKEEELGAYAFNAQYMQRPSPAEGAILKKSWFKPWKYDHLPKIEMTVQSWDTAFSDKDHKGAAYSACTTWGVWYDTKDMANVILLSMWRGRVGYPELRDMAKRLYYDYRDNGKIHNPNLKGMRVDKVIIEAKATGDPLIRDLRDARIIATPYDPTRQGDKLQRVHNITQFIEGGLVWLQSQGPNFERLVPEADEFLNEISFFPNSESRDLVDTMSQVLRRLNDERILMHPRDPIDIPSYYEQTSVY